MTKLIQRPSLLGCALLLACGVRGPGAMTGASSTSGDATDSDSTHGSTTSASTTDPTTSDSGTSPAGSSSGCAFVCLPDALDEELCNPYAQDCPEGKKCTAASTDGDGAWDANICVEVMPNGGAPGDECTAEGGVSGVDSCAKGSMCWNVNMDGQGVCVALCEGSPQAPTCDDADKLCVIANEGALNLCLQKCDPLLPDACPGEVCLPNPQGEPGFACVLDASEGMGAVNAPCAFANACNPGLLCVGAALGMQCDPNAGGCCQPYCDLSLGQQPDPNPVCDTQGGQFCLSVFDLGMAPPGHENVGVCGIPQ